MGNKPIKTTEDNKALSTVTTEDRIEKKKKSFA